jgi:hypothetical protein
MKKYDGYDQAQAFTGEYETLEPGGYICKILKVVSEEKQYGDLLGIGFDIVEGEHKDFYKRQHEKAKETNPDAKWRGMYYQTVKLDNLSYFKGFIQVIESSNPGYHWNWDEKTLQGKLFGGAFGEEEYVASDGKVKTAVKCMYARSVEQVRKGVKVPDIKKLSTSAGINRTDTEGEDGLPF